MTPFAGPLTDKQICNQLAVLYAARFSHATVNLLRLKASSRVALSSFRPQIPLQASVKCEERPKAKSLLPLRS